MKIIESHLRAFAYLELKEEELHLWQWYAQLFLKTMLPPSRSDGSDHTKHDTWLCMVSGSTYKPFIKPKEYGWILLGGRMHATYLLFHVSISSIYPQIIFAS